MNPTDPTQPLPPPKKPVVNPLSVMHEGEQILCEIKRHPIGIVGVYASAGVVILASIVAAIVLPSHITNISNQSKAALMFGAIIVSIVAVLYAYVAGLVYRGNSWVLTDDSLTQITQVGLFRKQSSQLSLANLEDVTAEQNGIMPSMFGYGVLRAETAGERSKFMFLFCPKPTEYARQILAAREAFIANDPAAAKRANDKLGVPAYPAAAPQPYDPTAQQQPQPPAAPSYQPAPAPQPYAQPQPYTQPQPYDPTAPPSSGQGYGQQSYTPAPGSQPPQDPTA